MTHPTLTVGKLRDLLRDLPDDMTVRYATADDEFHVQVVETHARLNVLMLSEERGDYAGVKVIFGDAPESWE